MPRFLDIDFDALPIPTRGCFDHLRRQGVPQGTLATILVKLAPVQFLPNRRFEFSLDDDAEPVFVVEATDACSEPVNIGTALAVPPVLSAALTSSRTTKEKPDGCARTRQVHQKCNPRKRKLPHESTP